MVELLRQRSKATSTTEKSGFVLPITTKGHESSDPSGKGRKKSSGVVVPIALVIALSGLVVLIVLSIFFSEEQSGRRQLEGPPDYSRLPLCIENYKDMPELWRPPIVRGGETRLFMDEETGEPQSKAPWTKMETWAAKEALQRALDQILEYYKLQMSTEEIIDFQPDGLNSILDMASTQSGPFHQQALGAARDMFILSASHYTD
jgi:hypothetical protein